MTTRVGWWMVDVVVAIARRARARSRTRRPCGVRLPAPDGRYARCLVWSFVGRPHCGSTGVPGSCVASVVIPIGLLLSHASRSWGMTSGINICELLGALGLFVPGVPGLAT